MYFLLSDGEIWNKEIKAKSWREALITAKHILGISTHRTRLDKLSDGNSKVYRVDNSADYTFCIRLVDTEEPHF